MKVADAVKLLTSVYGDLSVAARGIEVDQKELSAALAKAAPGSVEEVVLPLLVKSVPVVEPIVEPPAEE